MRRGFVALVLIAAVPLHAQPVVMADAPVDRAVTIYRAPHRNGGRLDLGNLGGFAVISETRVVRLPAGEAEVRFAGVAEAIVPESAAISGLPGGVIEKNRDAALLSPSALFRAARGRALKLNRTNPKTGTTETIAARLVSADAQGVVFATASGVEALHCSGLPETFAFADVGEGVVAQPTLSVRTRTAHATTATVHLTYLADNFDWRAAYVAKLAPDGRTANLTGWITLANGNGTGFADTRVQIVAGRLNRAMAQRLGGGEPRVIARCWPLQTTSDVPVRDKPGAQPVHPWNAADAVPPPPPLPMMMAAPIMVTAQRAMAKQEDLGDLKLYRLPDRTSVAARQMKQALLLERSAVRFDRIYRCDADLGDWAGGPQPATLRLRSRNDAAHHLGVPLPAGAIAFEQDQAGRAMLLGEPSLHDTALDERLDLPLGDASDVQCAWTSVPAGGDRRNTLTLTNAGADAMPVELRLIVDADWTIGSSTVPAPRIDGVPTIVLQLGAGERREIVIDRVKS